MRSADDANKKLREMGVDYLYVLEGDKSAPQEVTDLEVETCDFYECLNFFDSESAKCYPCTRNPHGPHFGGEVA